MDFKKGGRVLTIVLLMTCWSTAEKMQRTCSKTSVLTGTMNMAETKDPYVSTVIYSPLQKGQTLCYDLIVEGEERSGSTVFISVINVEQEYEIKFGYNFSIPTMEVNCMCDCPGWDDKCNREHEGENCTRPYGSGSGDCAKKYSNGHNDKGCTYFEPSEVCCDIQVYKQESKPDCMALYVGNPQTIYTLDLGFFKDSGEILNKDTVRLVSKDVEIDTEIGVVGIVGQAVERRVLYAGWYFMNNTDRTLFTGEPINGLNEQDVNKLGWYKFDSNGNLLPVNWNGLRQSFSALVSDCLEDKITWRSSAGFYRKKGSTGDTIGWPVNDVFKTPVHVEGNARSILVRTNITTPVLLHTRIHASAKVIFRYQTSTMKTFEAELVLDRFGNKRLLLFLVEASGLFYGSIEPDNFPSQSFTVGVASATPINIDKTQQISWNFNCPPIVNVKICLWTEGKTFSQCQMAPCREEKLTEAKHQDNSFTDTDGVSRNTVKSIFEQFQEKLQTIKDTVMGWIGWIGDNIQMIIVIMAAVIGVILFIVICCCLSQHGCCCPSACCDCKLPKKKRKCKRSNDSDEVDSTPAKDALRVAEKRANDEYIATVRSSVTFPETEEVSNEVKTKLIKEKNDDDDSSGKRQAAHENVDEDGPILNGCKCDDGSSSWSIQVVDKNSDEVYSALNRYSGIVFEAYLQFPTIDEEYIEV